MSLRFLDHLKGFTIFGEDAQSFAQSQLSCHVDRLAPRRWHPGAWCNGQGRVLTTLLIRVANGHIDCVLPESQLEDTLAGLTKFTIGRRVSFGTPQRVAGAWHDTTGATDPLSFDDSRGLAWGDADLAASTDAADWEADWAVADIQAGLAWLSPAVSGQFLPQALGLERLGGVSYDKGCYPGQEVIAKVHYRGQLKQHLVRLHWANDIPVQPPASALFLPPHAEAESSPAVGQVIAHQGAWGLAVVKTKVPPNTTLALSADGPGVAEIIALDSGA